MLNLQTLSNLAYALFLTEHIRNNTAEPKVSKVSAPLDLQCGDFCGHHHVNEHGQLLDEDAEQRESHSSLGTHICLHDQHL